MSRRQRALRRRFQGRLASAGANSCHRLVAHRQRLCGASTRQNKPRASVRHGNSTFFGVSSGVALGLCSADLADANAAAVSTTGESWRCDRVLVGNGGGATGAPEGAGVADTEGCLSVDTGSSSGLLRTAVLDDESIESETGGGGLVATAADDSVANRLQTQCKSKLYRCTHNTNYTWLALQHHHRLLLTLVSPNRRCS